MIALLNAPVLTAFGTFAYEPIADDDAKRLLLSGFQSFIGHQVTCDILSQLLGVDIVMNRAQYEQQVGEQALVFRLKKRVAEGQVLKTIAEINAIGYELALLTRKS